jgi:predicted nucleic acid-binding protein
MILIDTNVLVDILHDDPDWMGWSMAAFQNAFVSDSVGINDIVYAELAPGFDRMRDLDAALDTLRIPVGPIPRDALFLAGHAFKRYRAASGTKSNVLPDFFIGAHAAVDGATLLTRDPKRVRRYFPTVTIISP